MLDSNVMDLFASEFKGKAKISTVSADMNGKVFYIYGGNNLGKTYQASRFKNPIFMPIEKGLNAINGAMTLPVNCWEDLQSNVRKLSGKKFRAVLESGTQMTLVIDGAEKLSLFLDKYICEKNNVENIGDVPYSGGYTQLKKEIWNFVEKLTGLGYTIIFIGHGKEIKLDKKGERTKWILDGSESTIKYLRDVTDFTIFLKSNGVDDKGRVINSSAYLAETEEFFARNKFDGYVPNVIENFTAENLEKAVVEGIKAKNKAEGYESVTFAEQRDVYKNEETFEEVMEEVKNLFETFKEKDILEKYGETVEKILGEGVQVSTLDNSQLSKLKTVREALQRVLED